MPVQENSGILKVKATYGIEPNRVLKLYLTNNSQDKDIPADNQGGMNMAGYFGLGNSFFSTSSNNSTNWMSNLSSLSADYSSIRSGSYRKLVKAYYSKDNKSKADDLVSKKNDITANKELSAVKSDAEDLTSSAAALTAKGSKSLFKQKEVTKKDENGNEVKTMEYDMDAIYKAASAFVSDYNSMVKSGGDASSASILRKTLQMTQTTNANRKLLSDAGITISDGNKLTIDEAKFKEADINTLKTIFEGGNSYAGQIAQKASQISASAVTESIRSAGLYNNTGSYYGSSNNNLFNSFF